MKKKIIARMSNGFGNQLFLYAASYSFAKKLGYNLYLDTETGIRSLKNKNSKKKFKHFVPKFELNPFNISAFKLKNISSSMYFLNYIKRKLLLIIDKFSKQKNFIIEKKFFDKQTEYSNSYINNKFSNKIFIEGYFESEKYFSKYRSDILKEFSFKDKIYHNNKYFFDITNSNSVSLAIRRDRYTETMADDTSKEKINKTNLFESAQLEFILDSIKYFNMHIKNPKFFLFSDNFDNLDEKFSKITSLYYVKDFIKDKVLEDFFLMYNCKNFAVAPTSFHWWAAWLNNSKNKICLRPKNSLLNPSNNSDFWPEDWTSI
mgnify:FL=1